MAGYFQFRLQRSWRRQRRILMQQWDEAKRYIRFNLFGKGRQFIMVQRFTLAWAAIIVFCIAGVILQTRSVRIQGVVLQAQPGGIYSEAEVGAIKNINPILPENSASADASKLVFSGLTTYDDEGQIRPDLATDWVISPDGKTYTFHLRQGVTWHDGVPFNSQDVAFTLTAIQHPDTRSPLATNWQGVKVATPDANTVVYTLPKPYTPFLTNTTVGILPRHLLENIEPTQLRVAEFNQHPVGTGPFKIQELDTEKAEVRFTANSSYYLGKPLLDGVNLRWYDTSDQALSAYKHRQVLGVSRLQSDELENARSAGALKIYEIGVPDQVAVFFKTTVPQLQDKTVRTALAFATDRAALINQNLDGAATALTGPVLAPHLDLKGTPRQPRPNIDQANNMLESAGWKRGANGIREKDGKPLTIDLATQKDTAYGAIAKQLQQQWKKVGVDLKITEVASAELQQSYIRPRHYDAILYGINVGADPDVYAFWHSSQAADPGLNLSAYSSKNADQALEGGRTLTEPAQRSVKYRSFIQAWVSDTPAVMLYAPSYIYAVDSGVHGIHPKRLITPPDRFTDIQKWSMNVKTIAGH